MEAQILDLVVQYVDTVVGTHRTDELELLVEFVAGPNDWPSSRLRCGEVKDAFKKH